MQKLILKNKRAFHEFEVLNKYICGIVLAGHEVKSLKSGGGHFTGTFIAVQNGEAYVHHLHIPLYKRATIDDYNPEHTRKLLLSKAEILKIATALSTKGVTVIPLSILEDHHLLKLEIAVARGKKLYDKREDIKKRDIKRRIETSLKDY
ncbi:MAG: SsrA-binding protein SmpB [Candidatus Gracilibacteria bacterium]|jgi:SsrA-binding protein